MTRPAVPRHEEIGPDCPLDCLVSLLPLMSCNRLPVIRRARPATWSTCTRGTSSAISGGSGRSASPRSERHWFSPGSTSPGASSPRSLLAAGIIGRRDETRRYQVA